MTKFVALDKLVELLNSQSFTYEDDAKQIFISKELFNELKIIINKSIFGKPIDNMIPLPWKGVDEKQITLLIKPND